MVSEELLKDFEEKYPKELTESEEKVNSAIVGNRTNVVTGDKLRDIQGKTLNETKEFLSKTFGPMGSNTKIISGQNYADINSSYSKDGLKVLSHIINANPIEASIVEELIEVTKHVEKEVGDGTTSTVILSALIFDKLRRIEKKNNIPPYELIRTFKRVVNDIKEIILSHKKEITIDDIYNIAMISTNGNEEISNDIKEIYEKFGFEVDLNVGISNNEATMIKVYDGLTITEGMSDPAFINNRKDNTAEIHNAKVYHFKDPIDDVNMIALFEAIIQHNIYDPMSEPGNDGYNFIPTVITCPRMSSDLSTILKRLVSQLYQFDNNNAEAQKPPILVITNVIASDELIMDDIANLCGCKTIHKYIDPEVYRKEVEDGTAATVDNVWEFAGEAELVVANNKKTKFINPAHMTDPETGEKDPIYTSMVNFLESEIEAEKAGDKDANTIGLYKKRLSALKANMVDYLVGGITVSDRDNIKDLAEDAIKNCKSASLYGVGRAANYEGLISSLELAKDRCNFNDEDNIENDILECIYSSYFDAAKILYSTVESDEDAVAEAVLKSIENGNPYDISSGLRDSIKGEGSDNVICSIMLDINILETISKIITIMVTCNQCLLQASNLNTYE